MFSDKTYIYLIGLIAQMLFFSRSLVQWILSEKVKKVVSPPLFWELSTIASLFLFAYGWLRNDFAVILGQAITYVVYVFNLRLLPKRWYLPERFWMLGYLLPLLLLIYALVNAKHFELQFFQNKDITLPLMVWGTTGQVIFTLRFIYQGYYSKIAGESLLPMGFWVISLVGCIMIISYAIYRLDPILILSQITGVFIYSRNILLSRQPVVIEVKQRESD